ncbi:HNH endonuclease [Marinobacter sp.]|uniref:HNH endonuclease n=1 Tax=Marinobacter sp. TaxID=50741 RepID=UPI003A93471D
MGWIFQGNPKIFAIEEYLESYPELIYWRTPKYADRIAVGDRAYVWRSGGAAGAIAVGTVVEAPAPVDELKHPDALGDELWLSGNPNYTDPQTGIHIDEIRLSGSAGMVTRENAKTSEKLSKSLIMKMPSGTVFPLTEEGNQELERLWGLDPKTRISAHATEGEKKLRAHFRRERSRFLTKAKFKAVIDEFGHVSCELCGTKGTPPYPHEMAERIFEVHHRIPLATAVAPVKTLLEDLAVVCANCHRAVHSTSDVEGNFSKLKSLCR